MKIVAVILLFSLLSSCWPTSVSFKDKGSMPESWKTFSIKTLEINAANCPLSYSAALTEKLKDGIQNSSYDLNEIFYNDLVDIISTFN
jgi:hypothetical protein